MSGNEALAMFREVGGDIFCEVDGKDFQNGSSTVHLTIHRHSMHVNDH